MCATISPHLYIQVQCHLPLWQLHSSFGDFRNDNTMSVMTMSEAFDEGQMYTLMVKSLGHQKAAMAKLCRKFHHHQVNRYAANTAQPHLPFLSRMPPWLLGQQIQKQQQNCDISELRSCVKVDVAVLGSPSLMVLMVCGRKAPLNLKVVFLWRF